MIGVIGVAPAGAARVDCGSPGPHGGNMDTRLIGAGAVLYLPVAHEGALFAAGDLHAAMGDGEICGTGVEVSGAITLRLDVRSDLRIEEPVLETPDHGRHHRLGGDARRGRRARPRGTWRRFSRSGSGCRWRSPPCS